MLKPNLKILHPIWRFDMYEFWPWYELFYRGSACLVMVCLEVLICLWLWLVPDPLHTLICYYVCRVRKLECLDIMWSRVINVKFWSTLLLHFNIFLVTVPFLCRVPFFLFRWSVTQHLDVTKQLQQGIRYLDIRWQQFFYGVLQCRVYFFHFYTDFLRELCI